MSENSIKKAFSIAELILSLFVLALIAAAAISVAYKKTKAVVDKKEGRMVKIFECNNSTVTKDGYCDFYVTLPEIKGSKNLKKEKGGYYTYGTGYYADLQSKEFIGVTLIGGGAGGSNNAGGGGGEIREIRYPSLSRPFPCDKDSIPDGNACYNGEKRTCKCLTGYKDTGVRSSKKDGRPVCVPNFMYRIYPGKGGGTNTNGGDTKIVICEIGKTCNDKTNNLGIFETAAGGKVIKVCDTKGSEETDCTKGKAPSDESGSSNSASNSSGGNGIQYGKGGDSNQKGEYGEVIIKWR